MTTPTDRLTTDLFRAYMDARKHKRNTVNQLRFEMDFEHNLFELAALIRNRTYRVGRSVCFIVNKPVKREIFAADFRDRVVHHLIYNYVDPLFERKLIRDCYSCRKGFGTSDGIERIGRHIRAVTNNHTTSAWVLKLDIQGYFMSIDRGLLFRKVEKTVRSGGLDRELTDMVMFLLREIIFNDPAADCTMKSDRGQWSDLPPSKSLFHSPEGCGLPIGNLTSQMFSNLYLAEFDHFVKRELKMQHYGRYVDDLFFLHPDRYLLLHVRDRVTEYLKENYGLTVHPKKIYLQPLEHGVVFLGAHIKPHRMYVRRRTLGQMRTAIREADRRLLQHGEEIPDVKLLCDLRSLVNSYFGYTGAFKSHRVRKELWEACKGFQKYFSCGGDYRKIKIRKGYGAIDAWYREHPDERPLPTDDTSPRLTFDAPFPTEDDPFVPDIPLSREWIFDSAAPLPFG
jgi:hypothetical protein